MRERKEPLIKWKKDNADEGKEGRVKGNRRYIIKSILNWRPRSQYMRCQMRCWPDDKVSDG